MMQLRRPDRSGASAVSAAPHVPIWTQLDCFVKSSLNPLPSPAARSGHAMTILPSTNSVLLFGGADGKIFFEDVFLLEPSGLNILNNISEGSLTSKTPTESRERSENVIQWKKLVISRGTTLDSPSLHSPTFSNGRNSSQSSNLIGIGIERHTPTFIHPGGGRDYHSMHYVETSKDEENTRGSRILVIGNVLVATNTSMQGRGCQTESGALNSGMAFDTLHLRVEELRVKQPMLEAQWETRRIDHLSMWKPRARHAHSSVVIGGDQVFVFGGKDVTSTTFFNDIFYYDAPLNQWVKPSVHPTGQVPQPRAFAGLTASQDGKTLFLFGGTDGKQEFGSLFLYDVKHYRWDSLAGATMGDRPSCRINHSLTYVAPDHLVLFGGRRRAVRQNDLFVYHINKKTWRQIQKERPEGSDVLQDPVGRTAHATVLWHSEPAGPNAVQKLLIFGGYAGSHKWLDDLHMLSLSQSELTFLPPSNTFSQSVATQHVYPTRSFLSKSGARVALSAPQHPSKTQESLTSNCRKIDTQPDEILEAPQSCHSLEPEIEPTGVDSELFQSVQRPSVISMSTTNPQNTLSDSDTHQRTSAHVTVLADITNKPSFSSQMHQQELVATSKDACLPGVSKRLKRHRLADVSQESSNISDSSTMTHVGIQTMVLQLLQRQPCVEESLARIVAMLTRAQTQQQKQFMHQETVIRMHSEEQSKLLEAVNQRNKALEEKLVCVEAERDSLREKLVVRETELYMHKHNVETATPLLQKRVQAIEASHAQQLTVSRVIEAKISAVHDFMEELRFAGGEGTEIDDSPRQHQGKNNERETTEPTYSSPRPLIYPQRVVSALEEKLRVMQSEKDALEAKVKEMAKKVEVIEAREAQARNFLLSWCQGVDTVPGGASSMPSLISKRNDTTNATTNDVSTSADNH